MVLHFVRMGGMIALLVLGMVYPFLPGKYDNLAPALSTLAQLVGIFGVLLVPIGFLWLIYELRQRRRKAADFPPPGSGYKFALAALIAASIVVLLVALISLLAAGIAFATLTLTLSFYALSRLVPKIKRLKARESANINPAPFYLILVPITLLFLQIILAAPLTNFSRTHAIQNSAELIDAIENHYAAHGSYPSSLQAVWPDYYPSVVGIEKFHYALNGEAYNLFFEQPLFLLDRLGTREFVMYNKLDQHVMPSHAAWILIWSPEQLAANQGWYAVRDARNPHWKCFWFD